MLRLVSLALVPLFTLGFRCAIRYSLVTIRDRATCGFGNYYLFHIIGYFLLKVSSFFFRVSVSGSEVFTYHFVSLVMVFELGVCFCLI